MQLPPYTNLPIYPKLRRVIEPPCRLCRNFRPQPVAAVGQAGFVFNAVKLCHADQMFPDFSCFKPK